MKGKKSKNPKKKNPRLPHPRANLRLPNHSDHWKEEAKNKNLTRKRNQIVNIMHLNQYPPGKLSEYEIPTMNYLDQLNCDYCLLIKLSSFVSSS